MSNLNPPRLSRLFSSNPITVPSDGYGLVIPHTYVAFATIIVHNGRILDYPEVDTSSGTALAFGPDMYLRTTDSLRAINVAALTTVMTQDQAPVGTISAYAGNTQPPPGYMWLRKTKLDKTSYSALYAVIGDVFNDGTQDSNQFMLPDMEGRFLRAFDSTGALDAGRTFGSKQTDALQNITGSVQARAANVGGSGTLLVNGTSGAFVGAEKTAASAGTMSLATTGSTTNPADSYTFDASRVARTSTETRPTNIALNYIIKVTDGYKNPQLVDLAQLATDIATIKAKGSVGVVGQMRNLTASVTTAGLLLPFTVEDLMVTAGPGGAASRTGAFSRTLNLGSVGLGGVVAGDTVPNNGYMAVYALMNTVSGDLALIAQNATSAVMPENYGGTPQAGYNASALISVWPTNASGQWVVGSQQDRCVAGLYRTVLNSSAVTAFVNLNIAAGVPRNARTVDLLADVSVTGVTSPSSANVYLNIASTVSAVGAANCNFTNTGSWGAQTLLANMALTTPQQISYTTGCSGGTPLFKAVVTRYSF